MNRGWPPCDPLSARKTALRLFHVDDVTVGRNGGTKDAVLFKDECMDDRVDIMSEGWASEQAQMTSDDWVRSHALCSTLLTATVCCRRCTAAMCRSDTNVQSLLASSHQRRFRKRSMPRCRAVDRLWVLGALSGIGRNNVYVCDPLLMVSCWE